MLRRQRLQLLCAEPSRIWGTAIYFEIAERTHGVLYELPRQRLNWLWCALSLINSSACTCNVTDANAEVRCLISTSQSKQA